MLNKNLWEESLSIGDQTIDYQHKELILSVDNFRQACKSEYYTFTHFEYEEEIQLISGFPGYYRHKIIHTNFIDYVDLVSNRLKSDSFNFALLMELHQNLSKWIIEHITREDKLVGNFLKTTKLADVG